VRPLIIVLLLTACHAAPTADSADGAVAGGDDASAGDGSGSGEVQPPPAAGSGVFDPPSSTIHDHSCAGIDWQLIHRWLLIPHQPPAVAPDGQLASCVSRYAGWVTTEADAANVSRASVYAALAASGECDHDYDGLMVSPAQCSAANPGVVAADCAAQMASSEHFGIATIAKSLASTKSHQSDPPLMAAWLGNGSVACGGTDRWKLVAPAGYVDAYVAAYNSYTAQTRALPACSKRIILSVALYTGMGDPEVAGVDASNGCWTYERIAKDNAEWKICNYDGTVYHPDGVKWAYDDTNTFNDATTEQNRILACQSGTPGRGYIYMANRGAGWREAVTTNVRVHFAELYSSQTTIDDQYSTWTSGGTPGDPMVNFGEAATTAAQIKTSAARACAATPNGEYLGVYVYPQSLDGDRLSALVDALNSCTGS
jgi:hypothetical protein